MRVDSAKLAVLVLAGHGGFAVGHGVVRTVRKAGGDVTELAKGLRGPVGLAVDATGLYVAVHDEGTVLRVGRSGRRAPPWP